MEELAKSDKFTRFGGSVDELVSDVGYCRVFESYDKPDHSGGRA
jgi:cob(I)alamin adenosyltransferase